MLLTGGYNLADCMVYGISCGNAMPEEKNKRKSSKKGERKWDIMWRWTARQEPEKVR